MLGRYMAKSTVLKGVNLSYVSMDGRRMRLLFREMTKSTSITSLSVGSDQWQNTNHFGIDSIRDMVPFLKNSTEITRIHLGGNAIHTEGFELLMNALDGGPIQVLELYQCSIDCILTLENCTLPNLTMVRLSFNNIRTMPSLEKHTNLDSLDLCNNQIELPKVQGGAGLKNLSLSSNGITDEGVEVLVKSLQHNTSLTTLRLSGNHFTDTGLCPLLKLLNDVSSINGTLNSNHTLTSVRTYDYSDRLDDTPTKKEVRKLIKDATNINSKSSNPGREKILHTLLNSTKRAELARFQWNGSTMASLLSDDNGNGKSLTSSLLSDEHAFLLPEILSLVDSTHGQNELYHLLIEVVPYLL